MQESFSFHAIGMFHCAAQYPYDVGRQGCLMDNRGEIHLDPAYRQGLRDLEGFSHIWVVFYFHHAHKQKRSLLVHPPRSDQRVGVFASRSPHRPNSIGMSLVRLERIDNTILYVQAHDLLDHTPVLDIKPYLPYADSASHARYGWVETAEKEAMWRVTFSPRVTAHLAWLTSRGLSVLHSFIERELSWRPTQTTRKRITPRQEADCWTLAYRTWRIDYTLFPLRREVLVEGIRSGYTDNERASAEDPYADKSLHRDFIRWSESPASEGVFA